MITYTKDNHTVIQAEDGNFLMRLDGKDHDIAFSLGTYDRAENYEEKPLSEWPEEIVVSEETEEQ